MPTLGPEQSWGTRSPNPFFIGLEYPLPTFPVQRVQHVEPHGGPSICWSAVFFLFQQGSQMLGCLECCRRAAPSLRGKILPPARQINTAERGENGHACHPTTQRKPHHLGSGLSVLQCVGKVVIGVVTELDRSLCSPNKLRSAPELHRAIKQARNGEEQERHPLWAHCEE